MEQISSPRNAYQVNRENYEKLYRIEKKKIRRRSLLQGIILGVLLIALLICGVGFAAWLNQDEIAEFALDYLVNSYLQDLFATFPDAYVSNNQHKILPILDDFTNAAAAKRVTDSEFKKIGKSLILALKDKQMTYHEVTDILNLMKRASKRGNNLD